MKTKIKVDVVSDVVCPWCYIGKRRLEKATTTLSSKFEFEVRYFPFELNPAIPAEGLNQKEYLTKKFGGPERYEELTNYVTQTAASEGLIFDFQKQDVTPNTKEAHRIIWLAHKFEVQSRVKEALMRAYFSEGVDLTKKSNLISIGKAAGLPEKSIVDLFDSDDGKAEVELSQKINSQRGISGVPFYIINNKYGVSGAQPTETFIQIFEEVAHSELRSEVCDSNSANC